jgi:hypothetical protein
MIAEDEDPRAWLREIDPSSRTSAAREPAPPPMRVPAGRLRAPPLRASSVPRAAAREVSVEPAVEPAPPPAAIARPPTEPEAPAHPVAPPAHTTPPPAPAASTWARLAGDVAAALDLAAELERDLDATRAELVEARQALRRAEQQRDELAEHPFALGDAADAVANAEARFSERLLVLPSARTSAAESQYRDPEKLFRVLALLATFGQHDGTFADVLVKALGHAAEWKPKDSPETTAKFGAQRTWTGANGTRRLYSRHITLGGSVNPQRCLQIYYDVLPDGRIELAWIGEHRPTVGKDT